MPMADMKINVAAGAVANTSKGPITGIKKVKNKVNFNANTMSMNTNPGTNLFMQAKSCIKSTFSLR